MIRPDLILTATQALDNAEGFNEVQLIRERERSKIARYHRIQESMTQRPNVWVEIEKAITAIKDVSEDGGYEVEFTVTGTNSIGDELARNVASYLRELKYDVGVYGMLVSVPIETGRETEEKIVEWSLRISWRRKYDD